MLGETARRNPGRDAADAQANAAAAAAAAAVASSLLILLLLRQAAAAKRRQMLELLRSGITLLLSARASVASDPELMSILAKLAGRYHDTGLIAA